MDHQADRDSNAGLCELFHPSAVSVFPFVVYALFQICTYDLSHARFGLCQADRAGAQRSIELCIIIQRASEKMPFFNDLIF